MSIEVIAGPRGGAKFIRATSVGDFEKRWQMDREMPDPPRDTANLDRHGAVLVSLSTR